MFEFPLIFLGGLLGSAHCVGMCGGFVAIVGAGASSWRVNLTRQCIYSSGRIFAYASMGALVGYAGLRLVQFMTTLVNTQAWLALLAGGLLVVQGLISAGVFSRIRRWLAAALPVRGRQAAPGLAPITHVAPCLAPGLLGGLLRAPGSRAAFLAGMVSGFMPCGLVYAYLALATSRQDPFSGSLTMIVFGLGTVPLMVMTGTGLSLLSPSRRRLVLRLAAWCVVVTGLIAFGRGVYGLQIDSQSPQASCPFCE